MDKITFLRPILLVLALLLLCLVAMHPFFTESTPLTDDGSIHLYRSIVLDYSIRHDGVLYPRYSPALVYGYGAPLFNYFPPTGYYPTVIFHGIGLSWITAWKSSMIFYVLMAAWGAFLLGREWTDEIGGFITAAAYVYSPYALFDMVTRGTTTEFAGMAFLPFALWGFTRLAKNGRRIDFIVAALCYALFIILHNVMTLYGSLLLVAYCALLLLLAGNKKRVFGQILSVGILAMLITAFFWWPALTETDFVKINGVAENLDFINVRNTLRSLADIFALPRTADPTRLQAPIPITFAWPQLVLAIVGIGLSVVFKRIRQVATLQVFLLIIVSIVTFSQLKISVDFWQSIAILSYSQFAWRTMSIGSLALALLAGIGTALILDTIRRESAKIALFPLFLIIIVIYAIPWLYRPSIELQADSVADAIQYEIDTGELALSSYSEYLPVLTDESALERSRLLSFFAAGETIPRLQSSDKITVMDAQWSGTKAVLSLEASEATILIFDWLYFPGWQASIDGKPVEVFPVGDASLVGINLESGQHHITISLEMTDTQQRAVWLSLISLALFISLSIFIPFHNVSVGTSSGVSANTSLRIAVVLVGLALFLAKIALIDQTNNPLRAERFASSIESGVENAINADFSGEIYLLGSSSTNNVKSGEIIKIRLFWSLVDDVVMSDYSSILELRDSQGIIIAQDGSFYPGGLASTEWLSGYYLEEVINLEIPPATPPDEYTLDIGLYDSQTGQRLNVINTDGNPVDVKASVSTLTVEAPNDPVSDLPEPIFSDSLTLLEINGIPEQAQVGDEMIVDCLFQMDTISEESIQVKLIWLNSDNQPIAETQAVDIVNNYPTNQWHEGDVWRGYHRFYIPGNLQAGRYIVAIKFGESLAPIVEMLVTVPERNYAIPDFENTANASWQNGINLSGYDRTGNTVTLDWLSDKVLNNNLRLFVQVLDSQNHIIAIDDSIPVNWTRPTTSWDIGEVITTVHDFAELTEGDYHLLIGWYDPLSGQRVLLNNGEDALVLEQ
jgi:hypothetical protein